MSGLLHYAAPHWRMIAWGGILSFLGGTTNLAQPLITKYVIEALGAGQSIIGPAVALVTAVVGGAVLGALGAYFLERTGQSIVLRVRRSLVAKLLHLKVSDVDSLKPGDLVARLTSDTTLLRSVVAGGVSTAVTSSIILVIGLLFMALLDVVLFLLAIAMFFGIGLLLGVVLPRINQATKSSQMAVGRMAAHLERAFGAFRTVKAFSAEQAEVSRLDEAAVDAWHRGVSVAGLTALSGTATWMTTNVCCLAVLAVGGGRVAAGELPLSSLIAFLLLLFYMMDPISNLARSSVQLQSGLVAVRRINEVEELGQENTGSGGSTGAASVRGPASVSFHDVTFRYKADLPLVHRGVTFETSDTGLTALVGSSGAGKTTVFSLIERFYDVTSGTVRLDGIDVRDWPLQELRGQIGYVEQDAPVLEGSLRDNLTLAVPQATELELAEVVDQARLTDLVSRLPEGLDSPIGHRGTTLSGGERQRVAIARALLRHPRLLLMDEATSQLDSTNEAALREVMVDAASDTNVIVVAHRISTVTSADRIIVMEDGKVRAVGTHQELMARDDLYRDLAAGQLITAKA